ncbi:MAG: hypothetical protein Q7K43_04030, partial [Candidatus Woesearchaeota archaeon]|nr:hypothetical protein [Candidatus Woesearchaeota archaeon]
MARDEFDSEMDSYLAERRKEPLLSAILNRKKEVDSEISENSATASNQDTFSSQDIPDSELASVEPAVVVQEVTAPKQGFWSSLWKGVSAKDPEPSITDAPAQSAELIQDFKSVAKISLIVMKQLPEKELLQLKSSQEFIKFKEILKKH